jgi:hypothetical protein
MCSPPQDPPEPEPEPEIRPWSPRVRLGVFILAASLSWAVTLALIYVGWRGIVGLLRGR